MDIEKIRQDFPGLNVKIDGKSITYFDNACMSMVPRTVIERLNSYYTDYPGCAGRSVHSLSVQVTTKYEETRDIAASFFNGERNGFIFLNNTTAGLNLVSRSMDLHKGDVVLTTDREHNSNLSIWHLLREEKGIVHKPVPSNEDNTFNMDRFVEMLDKNVKLVSMSHVSNLDGVRIPAEEIIKLAHERNIPVMLDGAQAAPHMKLDFKKLDVDFYALSLHKMCGPTGTGILYGKPEMLKKLKPFIVGGGTVESTYDDRTIFLDPPERFEAGLQNYANVIANSATFEYLSAIGMDEIEGQVRKINRIVTEGVRDMDCIKIIGPADSELRSGIFSFVMKGISPHDLAMVLDESEKILIRSGLHCDHSWFNRKRINGSARASFYFYNTDEEAKRFVSALKKIYAEFSKIFNR